MIGFSRRGHGILSNLTDHYAAPCKPGWNLEHRLTEADLEVVPTLVYWDWFS
jgi:hypothetical protein